MFAKPHPVFVPPHSPDARLWRYMDLAKFLSLLQYSTLFFPRLDHLDDPFEGYYTKSILTFENLKFEDLPPELRRQFPDQQTFSTVVRNQKGIRGFAKEQRDDIREFLVLQ